MGRRSISRLQSRVMLEYYESAALSPTGRRLKNYWRVVIALRIRMKVGLKRETCPSLIYRQPNYVLIVAVPFDRFMILTRRKCEMSLIQNAKEDLGARLDNIDRRLRNRWRRMWLHLEQMQLRCTRRGKSARGRKGPSDLRSVTVSSQIYTRFG